MTQIDQFLSSNGNMPLNGGMVASTVFIFLLYWCPVPPLASPRKRGQRWPCTRPWKRGVHGSCTHLCQGQIEASQSIGININWVLCVTTSSITSNREFSYPLYFMHILNTSYSNLKSRSPMLVSQHVATASEIRMRRFGGGNPALPRNFCTISARIRWILANYLTKGYLIPCAI